MRRATTASFTDHGPLSDPAGSDDRALRRVEDGLEPVNAEGAEIGEGDASLFEIV